MRIIDCRQSPDDWIKDHRFTPVKDVNGVVVGAVWGRTTSGIWQGYTRCGRLVIESEHLGIVSSYLLSIKDHLLIEQVSPITGETNRMELPITEEQLDRWTNGENIQNVFPFLTDDQREFLKTGITPDEWDKYMKDDSDEDAAWEEDKERMLEGVHPQLRDIIKDMLG